MRLIHSLCGELLAWLGLPLLLLWALSVYTHYQSGLAAANQAYDRSLLLASLMLRRVLCPLRRLSRIVLRRDGGELTPLPSLPWSELQPLTSLLTVIWNSCAVYWRVRIASALMPHISFVPR